MCRVGISLVVASAVVIGIGAPASAAQLPQIELSGSNTVPTCVTPGRLMALVESANRNLPRQFSKIAVDYMRHGEDLGVRWDQAFYQMLHETAFLKFTGDVRARQNNFAGIGATGGGVRGESFSNVSDGVRAHLQHVLMYTGKRVDNPIADRTRRVQDGRWLQSFQDRLRGRPMTFTDLATQWAPGFNGYTGSMQSIANRFDRNFCNRRDPNPQLLALAKSGAKADRLASQAIARGRSNGNTGRRGLAGQRFASAGTVPYKVVNSGQRGTNNAGAQAPSYQTASAAGLLPKAGAPKAGARNKLNCHVYTASYGGQKAVIIKALKNGIINYTVLDVNQGREKRETEAYIAAYAKGGSTVGEYGSQNAALDRAFTLCPEG